MPVNRFNRRFVRRTDNKITFFQFLGGVVGPPNQGHLPRNVCSSRVSFGQISSDSSCSIHTSFQGFLGPFYTPFYHQTKAKQTRPRAYLNSISNLIKTQPILIDTRHVGTISKLKTYTCKDVESNSQECKQTIACNTTQPRPVYLP